MEQKIKLIALDIDQTTLRTDKTLSPAVKSALERAIDAGIYVVPASGRPFSTLPKEILGIKGIEYAVTSNGAVICKVKERQRCGEVLIKPELVERILQCVPDNLMIEAFVEGIAYTPQEHIDDPAAFGAVGKRIEYIRTSRKPVKDIREFILENKNRLDGIDVVVPDPKIKKWLWKKLEQEIPEVYVTSSMPQLVEICCNFGGKRSGLEWLGEHLQILPEEMAAFGDAENDSDMIQYAGLGVAMGNAVPALKEVADLVTLSNDEDGVAVVVEQILKATLA